MTSMATTTQRENPVDWAHCSARQWRKWHFPSTTQGQNVLRYHFVQYAKEAIQLQTFLHAICSRNRQFSASLRLAFIYCRRVNGVAAADELMPSYLTHDEQYVSSFIIFLSILATKYIQSRQCALARCEFIEMRLLAWKNSTTKFELFIFAQK